MPKSEKARDGCFYNDCLNIQHISSYEIFKTDARAENVPTRFAGGHFLERSGGSTPQNRADANPFYTFPRFIDLKDDAT